MPLEIGSVVEGKVTGITKFGAFIELPDGKTGMVHISEVASAYVKEITDYVSQNQIVRVKVIAITPEGKINLSMKRVEEAGDRPAPQRRPKQQVKKPYVPAPRHTGPGSDVAFRRQSEPQSFEEMMSRFKQTSDDKMSDLKRSFDSKRGSAPHSRSRGRS